MSLFDNLKLATLRCLFDLVSTELTRRPDMDTTYKELSALQTQLDDEIAKRTANVEAQYAARMSPDNLDPIFDKIYMRYGSGQIGRFALTQYIGSRTVDRLLALGFLTDAGNGWFVYKHPYV